MTQRSQLDQPQIIQEVYDPVHQALNVNIVASASGGSTVSIIDGTGGGYPAQVTSANALKVDGSGVTQPISAVSLPLPTGAATEATLASFSAKTAGALVPEAFDEVDLTYVGSTTNIATAVYKLASSTVATLTLSYDGSNRLSTVVKT